MKKLLILFAIIFAMGGCATTQSSPGTRNVTITELQEFVDQLQRLSAEALELKRTGAIAVLDGWLFDAGFWGVMLQKGKLRPDPDVVDSIDQLTRLAEKRAELPNGQELTDLEMGQVLAHYTTIMIGAVKYGIQEAVPQAMQLLALF